MKVLNLTQFLRQPEGTDFCKYAPCYTEQLEIKADNVGDIDFVAMDINGFFPDETCSIDVGEEFEYHDDYYGRDASYQQDQLFLVYSKEEVAKMISVLGRAL